MKIKLTVLFVLGLVLTWNVELGIRNAFASGTTAVNFLKGGAGARASGMGEAFSAVADDATALYWNPAALASLPGRSAVLMQAAAVQSTAYSYGAYGQKVGDQWGVGAGVQYQTVGTLTGRDEIGAETSGFTPTDEAFSLGASRRVGPVSVGAAAKFVQSKIINSASTVTGDLGVLWPGLLGGKLSAAFTATEVGGKIKYDTTSESLPSAYRLGFGYRPTAQWTFGLDIAAPKGDKAYVAAGLETTLMKNDRYSLKARGGYNTQASGGAGGMTGAAFGLGFGFKGLGVDYAFLPMGTLGQIHRISLSYGF